MGLSFTLKRLSLALIRPSLALKRPLFTLIRLVLALMRLSSGLLGGVSAAGKLQIVHPVSSTKQYKEALYAG
jgi:hypothetical protein